MEILKNPNFDFLGKTRYFVTASLLLIVGGILLMLRPGGIRYGVEFSGGTQLIVRFDSAPAVDHIRKRPFYPREEAAALTSARLSQDPPDLAAGPERAAEAACLRRRIDGALAKFSERERAVFILRHYHDLKVKEIAQALGVSLGTAKSYLFRSIRKLQNELEDAAPYPGDGDLQ